MTRTHIRFCCSCAVLAGITLGLTACQSNEATSQASMMDGSGEVAMGAINDTCPIMPSHEIDPAVTVQTANGETIAFCCAGCINAWNKKSDAERAAYVAAHTH
ncbi:MAG: hypothetical protein KC983_06400 [Phycisphaerales bacterium]|nr:hypothetical protein [Phycisphaerales bacterium]